MADRIKGITVVIGGDTTGLSKALSGVNKEISSTQKQLKDVERLLKLDPGNTELLAQKQRLLNDAVDQTKTKLNALQDAEKQVQQQFERGEVSQEQYDSLKREIISTETELRKAEKAAYDLQEQMMQSASEKALQEMEKAAADLDRQLGKVDGKDVRDVSDAAKDAAASIDKIDEKPVEEVASAASDAKSQLKGASNEASAFSDVLSAGALVEGGKALIDTVASLADETQEYRKITGTLETSGAKAGYTADETAAAYASLFKVLGDDQTTATTVANLQALKLGQSDLLNMISLVTGAWATYGDSIPIDGLAESVNETIRTGTVTGTFADVLNWGAKEGETFGVMLKENTEANKEWNDAVADAVTAEDYFNLALQDASSQQERANLVAQAMASQGLADTAEAWLQNNEDIVAANESQNDFMENAAMLSERVAPVIESVKNGANQLFETLLQLSEGVDFEQVAESVNQFFTVLEEVILFLADNQEVVVSALAAIAAGLAAVKIANFVTDMQNAISAATSLSSAIANISNVAPTLGSALGLLTNPIFLITAAVVALVALIATSGDQIQAKLQELDAFLTGVFATDWTTVFGSVIGSVLNAFMANVQNLWSAISSVLNGIIDFIRGVFTGDWERAWQGITEILQGVASGWVAVVKAPLNAIIGLVNAVIGGINGMIGKLNGISIDVPDDVPVIGGTNFGFDIPSIGTLPLLASGGTVLSGSAIVGEAGPELLTVGPSGTRVQPLSGPASSPARSVPLVGEMNFYGYSAKDGQAISRVVDRELGRLYGG